MILTEETYYSDEANREYLSVSQFKEFMGSAGTSGCEFRALMELEGKWKHAAPNDAMLIGSYVDSWVEGPQSFQAFVASHPDMYKRDGSLYAKYAIGEEIIERIQKDSLFMQFLSGEKQTIMTGEICGVPWKIKMDSYLEGKAIVDLKVVRNLHEFKFSADYGEKIDFVRYWGYDIQGAVYQEIVRQNTGETLPFFIAAATKEEEPEIEIIYIPQPTLDSAMNTVISKTPTILSIKAHDLEPQRCGLCPCCRHYKVLRKPIALDQLIPEW